MRQTVQTYSNGVLVSAEEIEVPDPEPSPEQRIAELEAQIEELTRAMLQ